MEQYTLRLVNCPARPSSIRASLLAFGRSALAMILSFVIAVPVYANKAETLYKEGQKAEVQNNYDGAYEAYVQALSIEPKNTKYTTAVTRMRFYAAVQHVHAGIALRESGKLPEATAEFAHALKIDPTNLIARMEALRTTEMVKAQAQKQEPKPQEAPSALSKAAEAAAGLSLIHI